MEHDMYISEIDLFSQSLGQYIDKSKFVVVEYSLDKIKYCFDYAGLGRKIVLAGNPPELVFATGGVVDRSTPRADRNTELSEAFALWATPAGQEYLEREMAYDPEPFWGEFYAFSCPTSDLEIQSLVRVGMKCDFSENSGNVTTMPDNDFCFILSAKLVNGGQYNKPFFLISWYGDTVAILALICSNEIIVSDLRDTLTSWPVHDRFAEYKKKPKRRKRS
jgi:hypothetical protein